MKTPSTTSNSNKQHSVPAPVYPVYDVRIHGVCVEFSPRYNEALEAHGASGAKAASKEIFVLGSNGIRTKLVVQ